MPDNTVPSGIDIRGAWRVLAWLSALFVAIMVVATPAIIIHNRLSTLEVERAMSEQDRKNLDLRMVSLETLASAMRTELTELRADVRWIRDAIAKR